MKLFFIFFFLFIVNVIANAQVDGFSSYGVSGLSGGTQPHVDRNSFMWYIKTYGNMAMIVVLMIGCIHAAYKIIKPKEGQDNWSLVITFGAYILAVAVMAGLKAWVGSTYFN